MTQKKEKKSGSSSLVVVSNDATMLKKAVEKFKLVKRPTRYNINVFAHISGPSGAGKTHLGRILSRDFIVKDLDDFLQSSAYTSGHNSKSKSKIHVSTDPAGKLYDDIVENIYNWVQETEKVTSLPIVFVGLSYVIAKDKLMLFPINAEWKYIIDIPVDTLMKQFIMRDLLYICNHKEQALDAIINTKDYSDRWKRENIKLSREYTNRLYMAHNYSKLVPDEIERRLNDLYKLKQTLSFDYYGDLLPYK